MAIPNLIGLLLLSGVVARETRAYVREREALGAAPERLLADRARDD
jgi:AGCS family alanine or glycine:cation symporter